MDSESIGWWCAVPDATLEAFECLRSFWYAHLLVGACCWCDCQAAELSWTMDERHVLQGWKMPRCPKHVLDVLNFQVCFRAPLGPLWRDGGGLFLELCSGFWTIPTVARLMQRDWRFVRWLVMILAWPESSWNDLPFLKPLPQVINVFFLGFGDSHWKATWIFQINWCVKGYTGPTWASTHPATEVHCIRSSPCTILLFSGMSCFWGTNQSTERCWSRCSRKLSEVEGPRNTETHEHKTMHIAYPIIYINLKKSIFF